jgi:hypothetical protein
MRKSLSFIMLLLVLVFCWLGPGQAQPAPAGSSYLHLSPDVVTLLAHLDVLKYAQYASRCFFVDAKNGQANTFGQSMAAPFQKIQSAVNAATTGAGDFIVLMPTNGTNYDDDVVSASLSNAYVYINKANLTIVGMNGPEHNEVVIYPGAAATAGIFNLGAAADRVHLVNLMFMGSTAGSYAVKLTAGSDWGTIENCLFRSASHGIYAAGTVTGWVIKNNQFLNCTYAGIEGYFSLGRIEGNTIGGSYYNTVVIDSLGGIVLLDNTITANSDGTVVLRNVINGGKRGSNSQKYGIVVHAACEGVMVAHNVVAWMDTSILGVAANGDVFINNQEAYADSNKGIIKIKAFPGAGWP